MKIPYVNLALQHQSLKAELMNTIGGVIDSGRFILGDAVLEFEKQFAELCGVKFAVAVTSGTKALILALRLLNIGPGDEVITVPNSFVASTSCIFMVGASPVFVDVRNDYNINTSQIERVITEHTKAIIPVHLTGRPAEMDTLKELSRRYGIHIIEDCAQAVLARYRNKMVGSFGIVNCFSLHPLKTLNALGDGGIVTTNDKHFYERLRVLRNIGLATRDDCVEWSDNSRLDTIKAAGLLVKLKYLDEWTKKRRWNAQYYQKNLSHISQVECPVDREYEYAVYHTFVIQAHKRNKLKEFLAKRGIGTAVHYPVPIHLNTAARVLNYTTGDFPVSEKQAQRILSLPIHQDLDVSELEYVVDNIKAFYDTYDCETSKEITASE